MNHKTILFNGHNIKNIMGAFSGRLVAIKPSKIGDHGAIWMCHCSCGNILEVRSNAITSKRTKSCGCLHKDTARKIGHKNRKQKGEASFNSLLYKYKSWDCNRMKGSMTVREFLYHIQKILNRVNERGATF